MGIFYALVQAATFGLIPLFTLPLLSAGVPVETALVYRFGIAALTMGLILPLRGKSLRLPLTALLKISGLGLLYMFAVLFFFQAFSYLPSGVVATLQFQYPVMVLLIMTVFFHEPFRWRTGAAMLLAVCGAALLSLNPEGAPAAGILAASDPWRVPIGVSLSLLAGLCNALYFVGIQVVRLPRIDDLVLTFYIMLIGAIFCVINALAGGNLVWINSWPGFGTAVLLALVTAVISNLTLIMAIKLVGSTITSILGVLEPLTAVTVGCLIFGEPFNSQLALGGLLIVGSVLLVLTGRKSAG